MSAVLLVVAGMDLRAMALATLAVGAERLAPDAPCLARIVGAAGIGGGLALAVRTLALG